MPGTLVVSNVEPGAVGHSLPNSQSSRAAARKAMPAATKDQIVLRRAMAWELRSMFS